MTGGPLCGLPGLADDQIPFPVHGNGAVGHLAGVTQLAPAVRPALRWAARAAAAETAGQLLVQGPARLDR